VAERYLKRWQEVERSRTELLHDFPQQFSKGLPYQTLKRTQQLESEVAAMQQAVVLC
jgi:hypothetical protein